MILTFKTQDILALIESKMAHLASDRERIYKVANRWFNEYKEEDTKKSFFGSSCKLRFSGVEDFIENGGGMKALSCRQELGILGREEDYLAKTYGALKSSVSSEVHLTEDEWKRFSDK